MKSLTLILLLLTLTGCGTVTEVDVTIIKVTPTEGGWNSCMGGENYLTTVKTEDGKVDMICAYLGEVGDTVRGEWMSGHWDSLSNGFRSGR